MKQFQKKMLVLLCMLCILCLMPVMGASAVGTTTLRGSSSKKTITLKWSKVSGAKGYNVYKVNTSTGALSKYKSTSKTSLSIKNCNYGQTYTYVVRAYDKAKVEGASSNSVSIKPAAKKPKTPKNFRSELQGTSSVNVKWGKVSGCNGYVIEAKADNESAYSTKVTMYKASTVKAAVSGFKKGVNYTVRIRSYINTASGRVYSDPSNTISVSFVKLSEDAAAVRSAYYKVKAKSSITLSYKSGGSVTVPKGTQFLVSGKEGSTVSGYFNGRAISVKRSLLTYYGLDTAHTNDYSKAVKEEYINSKGYTSPSNYLIWVSQYKATVNIFKKVGSKWSLVQEFTCVVGKWSTRTPNGKFRILKKDPASQYGGPALYFTPGIKNGGTSAEPDGCAFHRLVDKHYGDAASHGCVRLKPVHVRWMMSNIAKNTTVIVY